MGIYKVWQERIESGVFSKSQCQQFALVASRQALGLDPRGHRTNLTRDEAEVLVIKLRDKGGVRLTPEHEAQGLEWLRKYGAKVFGPDFPIREVLDEFDHFTFNGRVHTYGYAGTAVTWRIHLKDGRMLDYYNIAWMSGLYNQRDDNQGWEWVDPEVLVRAVLDSKTAGEHERRQAEVVSLLGWTGYLRARDEYRALHPSMG